MKILKLFMLTVLLCYCSKSFCQEWSYYRDFPLNISPMHASINNAGTLFMTTSNYSLFYKTPNNNWQGMETADGPFMTPYCISAHKSSNTLVVGDAFAGGLYISSNFGASWTYTELTTNEITGRHEDIIALSNITNLNYFYGASFSGLTPTLIKYTNQGQDGQIIEFDPNDDYHNQPIALHIASNQKLLIGTEAGGIWLGNNNGTQFLHTTHNQNKILRFAEGANGRVYALGYNSNSDLFYLIYSDDYMNWTPMNLPNSTDRYNSIHYDTTTQSLWVGSETGINKMSLSVTGTPTWENASFNNSEQFLVDIVGNNSGRIYNFANQTIVQKLEPNGTTWTNINNGLTGDARKAFFGNNDKLFASSYYSNNVSSVVDLSSNWVNVHLGGITSGIRTMFRAPNGNIYADTGLKIKKSIDNGQTFSDITPPNLNNYVSRFYVGETGKLFMIKSNEIDRLYWSQDEGNTWSILHVFPSYLPFFPDEIASIAEDSNGVIYVTMNTLETSENILKIYYSSDQGLNWNTKIIQMDPTNPISTGIIILAKSNKVFAQYGQSLFTFDYTNTANDLVAVNPPAEFNNVMGGIILDNVGNYYATGEELFKSTDGGATWINLGKPDELIVWFDDIFFDSNNDAYAIINNTYLPNQRGIYKVTENLGTQNPSTFEATIYPNPTTGILNITTGNETVNTVSIYSLTGAKIKEFSRLTSVNLSDISVGMYLLKVTTDSGKVFTNKVIKD